MQRGGEMPAKGGTGGVLIWRLALEQSSRDGKRLRRAKLQTLNSKLQIRTLPRYGKVLTQRAPRRVLRNAGIPHYSPAIVKTLLLTLIILTTACFAQQEAADFKALEKKAADGDAEAQIALGLAYDVGRGVEQDRRKAVEWFQKAAAQGSAEAQFNLGTMYARGTGVEKNETKAFAWFEKAAEQGSVDAQFNLANMYKEGRGTEKNLSRAITWYDRAGIHGMTRAQYNLGLMYAAGEGVPANSVKAYAWLSLAAADGDPAAKKLANFIWSKTTTEAQKETLKKVAADLATKIKK